MCVVHALFLDIAFLTTCTWLHSSSSVLLMLENQTRQRDVPLRSLN